MAKDVSVRSTGLDEKVFSQINSAVVTLRAMTTTSEGFESETADRGSLKFPFV